MGHNEGSYKLRGVHFGRVNKEKISLEQNTKRMVMGNGVFSSVGVWVWFCVCVCVWIWICVYVCGYGCASLFFGRVSERSR